MGELAPAHLIIVLVVVLLLFGARRIPDVARSLGSGLRELRDGVTGRDMGGAAPPPGTVRPPASPPGPEADASRPPTRLL